MEEEQGQDQDQSKVKVLKTKHGRTMSAKYRAHIWKRGQSGNPKGRTPKRDILECMEMEIRERAIAAGIPEAEAHRLLARGWLTAILKGSAPLTKEYLDRTIGPVVQRVEQNVAFADVARAEFEAFMDRPRNAEVEVRKALPARDPDSALLDGGDPDVLVEPDASAEAMERMANGGDDDASGG